MSPIWRLLRKKRKIDIFVFLISSLIAAFLEALIIYSLETFLIKFTSDDFIENKLIYSFFKIFNIENDSNLALYILFLFILSTIASAIIRLYNIKLSFNIAASIGNDLSKYIYRNKLEQTYLDFINSNSSKILNICTREINNTLNAISILLQGITFTIISTMIVIIVSLNYTKTLFLISLVLFFTYLLISLCTNKFFYANSKVISSMGEKSIKILQETLDSFKDILLNKKINTFYEDFSESDLLMRKAKAKNDYLSTSPRYVIEATGLIFIISLAYFSKDQPNIIAKLGALAFSLQRLLIPAQGAYGSWAAIKSYEEPISNVVRALNSNSSTEKTTVQDINFKKIIKLEKICFSYNKKKGLVLKDINLNIYKNSFFGIIGSSGSGKSTLLDLIMCLLKPTKGKILIDNMNPFSNEFNFPKLKWKTKIGHVQQTVYLLDKTIIENIAFGLDLKDINKNSVYRAAKIAEIHNFIISMPNGYNTIAGEKGIQLSGGQKQRIGIARALYYDPELLVLDEATSGLDPQTEKKVIQNIKNNFKNSTVIMVTHRLEAAKECDKVALLSNGRLKAFGDPKEVIKKSLPDK